MIRYSSNPKPPTQMDTRTSIRGQSQQSLHSKPKHPLFRKNVLLYHNNMPILKCKRRSIPIYLLYKDKKSMVKSFQGMTFSQLVPLLYKEIFNIESAAVNRSEEDVIQSVKNVLGFSTVCNDLQTDYLLSLKEGTVRKSLILECFMKRKQSKKIVKGDRKTVFGYQICLCLAIGGFSKVYLARSLQNGRFYAIKFIKKKHPEDQNSKTSIHNQIQISSEVNHPFLVKMSQAIQTNNFYSMIFEYCPGGQLFYLLKRVSILSQVDARFYFIQILLGIKYLHENNIIYRDLKPQNILIDYKGNLKIVDFGLSKKISSQRSKSYSYCGSVEYMAPQMILRSGHDRSIDYYSLGALLYELVTGLPPFYNKNQQQLQQSIINQQLSFPPHIPLSPQLKDLLIRLLAKDHRVRLGSYMGIKQITIHPWIGKFNPSEYLNKSSYLKVPFPPNLYEHNFDVNQLGEDQQEFTQMILKELQGSSVQYLWRGDKGQRDVAVYDTEIQGIVKEFREIRQIKQKKQKQAKMGESRMSICESNSRKQLKNIHKSYFAEVTGKQSKENKRNAASEIEPSSPQKSRYRNMPINSLNSLTNQKSVSKQKRKMQHDIKAYNKLLPYFCKTKVCKTQNPYLTGLRKNLTKTNILKAKIILNQMKQQSY